MPLLRSEITGNPQLAVNLGNGQTMQLTQGDEIALKAPMNGANAVNLANAPLVFVGYGVTAPERNWDDFKGVDVTRQAARRPHQRPRLRGRRRRFRRQGDDLLRPLDLQI